MATLTDRIPDDKHLRLKELTELEVGGGNQPIEKLSPIALWSLMSIPDLGS